MRTVNLLPAVLLLQLLLTRRLAGRSWVKCYPGRYPRASLSNVTQPPPSAFPDDVDVGDDAHDPRLDWCSHWCILCDLYLELLDLRL